MLLPDDIDELYDLLSDPWEMKNLEENEDYRVVISEMKAELERLKKAVDYATPYIKE
jgi:cell division septum initiation protein DivIVA